MRNSNKTDSLSPFQQMVSRSQKPAVAGLGAGSRCRKRWFPHGLFTSTTKELVTGIREVIEFEKNGDTELHKLDLPIRNPISWAH